MTEFLIDYNPYLVTCTFMKNGRVLGDKTKIGSKGKQRLQVLLSSSANWDGLLEEIAKVCNDVNIHITFKGRRIDFEDLQYCVQRYSGDASFTLLLEEGKNESVIMSELDQIIEDIKSKNLPQFSGVNEDGNGVFSAYNEAKNGIFEVSVIATMSSGKSTLINSLLHTELLPSENKACTATIARILDNDEMDSYEATCYAQDNSTIVYPRTTVTSDLLRQYNADENVQYIDIEGSIPSIPSDKIKLCLRDTPGPNNSRNENHERLTRSIIKRSNAVIMYVMNTTQFGTNDDKQLLCDIAQEMKRAGKQSRDRFIFVINKCDALDEERGETIDKLLADVTEYLAGFGIQEPTLIPTSARLALLIRKSQNGEPLSRKERKELEGVDDFVESPLLHFEKWATLTPSVRAKLESQVAEYHQSEETWDMEALIHTGVPAVEATIAEYIDKYAFPMKINDALKDIMRTLTEMNMRGKFEKSIASDSEQLERVRAQIQEAKRKRRESGDISQDFKSRVSQLTLDSPDREEEQFNVEMELQTISKEYDGLTKVDKTAADLLIADFQRKLMRYQQDCESRLQREIDVQIFQKCASLLDEYARVVTAIIEDLEIDGFDFRKVESVEQISVRNVDEIIRNNQQDRGHEDIRWKDNPEREGFWGFFKFWKPRRIPDPVFVKDGVDVNVKNVVVDVLTEFSKALKKNIVNLFAQADDQVRMYQQRFALNMDRLDERIADILQQLEEDTAHSDTLAQKVEADKEIFEWISQAEDRISTLLSV